jgi:hypothetical protein
MRHDLTAVFNNQNDAQHALDELLVAGYPHSGMTLVSPPEISAGHTLSAGPGGTVKQMLARLFGPSHDGPERVDESSFLPGRHVITMTGAAEGDSVRAVRIIERFSPVYIEDRHKQAAPHPVGAGLALTAGQTVQPERRRPRRNSMPKLPH